MSRFLFLLAIAVFGAGCASGSATGSSRPSRIERVRATYAQMMQCPQEQVSAVRNDHGRDKGYDVDGCGRHARCKKPEGPCTETFTAVQRLDIARRTFSQETNCPVVQVNVYFEGNTVITDGCGRYAHCPEIGGPCFTIPRPSCESIAQKRLDACRSSLPGSQPSDRNASWDNPSQVAGAVGEVVKTARSDKDCNELYEQDLQGCRQAVQAAPATQPGALGGETSPK